MYHVDSFGIDPVSKFKLNRQYRGQISSSDVDALRGLLNHLNQS